MSDSRFFCYVFEAKSTEIFIQFIRATDTGKIDINKAVTVDISKGNTRSIQEMAIFDHFFLPKIIAEMNVGSAGF